MEQNLITTDEQTLTLKWRVAIPIILSLLIGSNALTAYSYQIEENETEIIYERQRTDRKMKNQLEETKQLLYIQKLERDVSDLKQLLDDCEEEK